MIKSKDDIIVTTKWWTLADCHFDRNNPDIPELLKSNIVAVDPTSIREFFEVVKSVANSSSNFNRKKIKVITARSDYGPVVQARNSPASDLPKWIKFQINEGKQGYNDLFCPARVNKERSNIEHKFSIKCYAHTDSTFDEIPAQIDKWYVCNFNRLDADLINDSRIVSIPFGVQDEQVPIDELFDSITSLSSTKIVQQRPNIVYCNWQFYTLERYEAFNYLRGISQYPGFNNLITYKRDRPHQEYLADLSSHKFVFCPRGNGLDSYRVLEVYYMGAIPIFESVDGIPQWVDDCMLPYISVPDYRALPLILDSLQSIDITKFYSKEVFEKLNFSYWRNKIVGSSN